MLDAGEASDPAGSGGPVGISVPHSDSADELAVVCSAAGQRGVVQRRLSSVSGEQSHHVRT